MSEHSQQDVVLPPGANPRPPGPAWQTTHYEWSEETGVAEFGYRRAGAERTQIFAQQPSNPGHAGWSQRPADPDGMRYRHLADVARGLRLDEYYQPEAP